MRNRTVSIIFIGVLLIFGGSPVLLHSEEPIRGSELETNGPSDFVRLLTDGVPVARESILSVPIANDELDRFKQDQYDPMFEKPYEWMEESRSSIVKEVGKPVVYNGTKSSFGELGTASQGEHVWSAAIKSNQAIGIRIHFTDVDVPNDVELYIYSDKGQVVGPYMTEPGSGDFWTDMVFGSTANMVLRQKSTAAAERFQPFRFVIAEAAHMGSLIARVEHRDGNVFEFREPMSGILVSTLKTDLEPEQVYSAILDGVQTGSPAEVYEYLTNGESAPQELILAGERQRETDFRQQRLAEVDEKLGKASTACQYPETGSHDGHCHDSVGIVRIDGEPYNGVDVYSRLKMCHEGYVYICDDDDDPPTLKARSLWHECGQTICWSQLGIGEGDFTLDNVPGSLPWAGGSKNKTHSWGSKKGYYEVNNYTQLGCHEIMSIRWFKTPSASKKDDQTYCYRFFYFYNGDTAQYHSTQPVPGDIWFYYH